MYYDDTDAQIDDFIIEKREKEEQAMLTVNFNNDNVNKTNNNEVAEMANDKKVAVVFVNAKGKMSKPMMAVEDVAEACKDMDWRDIYAKEDYPKALQKRGLRIAKGKTIANPNHVKELGVASGKLQPLAAYKVLMRKVRLLDKTYIQKAVDCFNNATIKYYDEKKKRPISYDEAVAKTKVQDAKTIIEVEVDKPVSLFSQAEEVNPVEIKVDLDTDKRHPGFKESDGFTFDEYMTKLKQERQEGIKRLIDDLRAFDWDDGLLETQQDNKEKALEAIREAKQQIENAEKLLEEN